jgi:hypothetical protein
MHSQVQTGASATWRKRPGGGVSPQICPGGIVFGTYNMSWISIADTTGRIAACLYGFLLRFESTRVITRSKHVFMRLKGGVGLCWVE